MALDGSRFRSYSPYDGIEEYAMAVAAEPPRTHPAATAARTGIWLLPVHAVLLAVGTLTHQPDKATAFGDYARYVTTEVFLSSHLVASIAGAAGGPRGGGGALPGPWARRAAGGARGRAAGGRPGLEHRGVRGGGVRPA